MERVTVMLAHQASECPRCEDAILDVPEGTLCPACSCCPDCRGAGVVVIGCSIEECDAESCPHEVAELCRTCGKEEGN